MYQQLIEWHEGVPAEAGWYLASLSFNESNPVNLTTVMLWYNPASPDKWYFGCGIGGGEGIDFNRQQSLSGRYPKQNPIVKYWAKRPDITESSDLSNDAIRRIEAEIAENESYIDQYKNDPGYDVTEALEEVRRLRKLLA